MNGGSPDRKEVGRLSVSKVKSKPEGNGKIAKRPNDADKNPREVAVRIAYDRLEVMARNERLVRQAAESLGETTARVYSKLLYLAEDNTNLPPKGALIVDDDTKPEKSDSRDITTAELMTEFLQAKDLLPIKTSKESQTSSFRPSHFARTSRNREGLLPSSRLVLSTYDKEDQEMADASPSSSSHSSEDEQIQTSQTRRMGKQQVRSNEHSGTNGSPSKHHIRDTLRHHLFLLSSHAIPFLIHQPAAGGAYEAWIVPYTPLIEHLRLDALFETIHARYDEPEDEAAEPTKRQDTAAVRIARMLHERGKLDDKALANLSLINPKQLRARLAIMHDGGALCVQEVPRDAARNAARTLYLWYFDEQRCARKFVEDAYQSMTRLLQRLRHERALKRHVLEKAERSDVRGNEEQWLTKGEREQLQKWRVFEKKVWSQIGRLDDLVALLRDY